MAKEEGRLEELLSKPVLTVQEYLDVLHLDSRPARTAVQRVHDMVLDAGVENYQEYKQNMLRYKFFSDVQPDGSYSPNSIFGLESNLMSLVSYFKNAAYKLSADKRILLLHGPVGSAKSTIVRLLKKGIAKQSETDLVYTFEWKNLGKFGKDAEIFDRECEMHEEPLKLIPFRQREEILQTINESNRGNEKMIYIVELDDEDDLCPACKTTYNELMKKYNGDWEKVMSHVEVRRLILSERERKGIATFQPKDEKNQDSTELTGDINYRKIAAYGSDSDPRAFNFDGELCRANRGIMEFIEILKLERAFLYDLLGASQEKKIKPKKFPLIQIDELIIGHTNEEDLQKLKDDNLMKAFRDRTYRIDIPYNLNASHETKIYMKDFNPKRLADIKLPLHIAPHTLEVAAMWAVLTRLEESPKADVMQKLLLYDGRRMKEFTEETVKQLKESAIQEGMEGVSPRFLQNSISQAISQYSHEKCINPFMVMRKVREGLKTTALIDNAEAIKKYEGFLELVEDQFKKTIQDEVRAAISGNREELDELCNKYIINLMAYTKKIPVKDEMTGKNEQPDERLMRTIEERAGISDSVKDDFRSEIVKFIGYLAVEGKQFDYTSNEQLKNALELKLFNDKKDTINFQSMFTGVVDKKEQEKIDVMKSRLIKGFGYCDCCATDALNYIASIFAKEKANKI